MAIGSRVERISETTRVSLLNRTVQNLREAWRDMADRTSGIFSAAPAPNLVSKDVEPIKTQMRDCLEARGGEVSARSRAANLGRTYLSLSPQGRRRFLKILADEFGPERAAVDRAMTAVQQVGNDRGARLQAEQTLRQALRPPWLRLLTQFNGLPEGVHFLVDLRAELLTFYQEDPVLEVLENELRGLLATWFDIGFLEMQRITWDSPAALLEKLIAYEAVHAIKSWDDLKKRLDSDRRCFGFFHPRMPAEPLIFVEVALVDGMADNVQALLDEEAPPLDPAKADTAIFYSISNAQAGLAGISFGNFLIKRVVDVLADEFKNLKTFATLSPIPGFRAWLDKRLVAEPETALLQAAERKVLETVKVEVGDQGFIKTLLGQADWPKQEEVTRALKAPLLRLCARYLAEEKRKDGAALDRVAHFHLSNGARIERLNWLGNVSPEGLKQSAGIMVNYRYKLDDIEANHEAYTGEKRVRMSSSVKSLLRGSLLRG
jgi:malonyl-CoA decarboxylase